MPTIQSIRNDFPILKRMIDGYPIAYLDNAATTQKPTQVIEAISNYYRQHNANVNRGVHTLAEESTQAYEDARHTVAEFIGAKPKEVIFVRNTTEALNLVVYGWGLKHLKKDDEIVLTQMEHHSNIVPWQMVAARTGAKLKFIEVMENGELNLGHRIGKAPCGDIVVDSSKQKEADVASVIQVGGLKNVLTNKTKIVSLVHVSNTLGTINPVAQISKTIKKFNKDIVVMVDGAQSVPHMQVNVGSQIVIPDRLQVGSGIQKKKNGSSISAASRRVKDDIKKMPHIDFLAFSGHKMCGPMGIGVLWGKQKLLEDMDPFLGGGDMIAEVYLNQTTFNQIPEKFEAGTPNVADAVGLAAAMKYLNRIQDSKWKIQEHEEKLTNYFLGKLSEWKEVSILGPKDSNKRGGLVAFEFAGVHAHDIAQVMNSLGIAVRSGHHCTMPLHKHLQVPASTRVSTYLYNTKEEIDRVIKGLEKVKKVFGM
jgi:cysteine desulfurase/selenocysteine lyase